jgi:hypothetical protein
VRRFHGAIRGDGVTDAGLEVGIDIHAEGGEFVRGVYALGLTDDRIVAAVDQQRGRAINRLPGLREARRPEKEMTAASGRCPLTSASNDIIAP